MQQLRINGGNRLVGEVRASGAKNAALPILAAALLTADDLVLHNVPDLADVRTMLKLLEGMGVKVTRSGTDVTLNAGNVTSTKAPYELVKTMRASVLTLCPLAARFGSAEVSLPGGCAIGARPVDQHIRGLRQLGATVDYAILMTTRYKAERLAGKEKRPAVITALSTSIPSIIVSGMGLFAATFGVAIYSDIDIISSMCMLMARGAIVSMLCVILILPALLLLCDRLVCATTLGMRHCNHSRKHAEKQDASAR